MDGCPAHLSFCNRNLFDTGCRSKLHRICTPRNCPVTGEVERNPNFDMPRWTERRCRASGRVLLTAAVSHADTEEPIINFHRSSIIRTIVDDRSTDDIYIANQMARCYSAEVN